MAMGMRIGQLAHDQQALLSHKLNDRLWRVPGCCGGMPCRVQHLCGGMPFLPLAADPREQIVHVWYEEYCGFDQMRAC